MTTKSETLSDSVSAFAALWFGYLDVHAPAGRLEACLSADDLETVFPERTLRSVAEFRDWYRTVCGLYTDETHEIEQVTPTRSGHHIDVGVVVVWCGGPPRPPTAPAWRCGPGRPGGCHPPTPNRVSRSAPQPDLHGCATPLPQTRRDSSAPQPDLHGCATPLPQTRRDSNTPQPDLHGCAIPLCRAR
jgi:hypothetical protein